MDTLYVADDSAAASGGGIQKYTLIGTNWTFNSTISSATSIRGLTGVVNGGVVTLYGTTGASGAAGSSSIYAFTDSTGYNGSPTGTVSVIATAATNEAFRGIAFVPNAAPVLSAKNFNAINENDTNNTGTLVSDLIKGEVTDASANAVQGIAITATDTTNGSWQYTTDGGSHWNKYRLRQQYQRTASGRRCQ